MSVRIQNTLNTDSQICQSTRFYFMFATWSMKGNKPVKRNVNEIK